MPSSENTPLFYGWKQSRQHLTLPQETLYQWGLGLGHKADMTFYQCSVQVLYGLGMQVRRKA